MISQAITPELRQWIIQQATTGKSANEVLKSMLASGWSEDIAITAMEGTLRDFLQSQQAQAGASAAKTMPQPLVTPANTIRAGDRDVQVLMLMQHPRVLVLSGLLADAECDALMEMAHKRLKRAETVQKDSGANMQHEARTSDGMFFSRGENALCQAIEARMAALMNWPVENGEGLQVLRYGPGAEYKPHYDYFDTTQAGTPKILERGGQRLASLVCYLNTPAQGGATIFPDVGLDVSPVRGNAVYFSYDQPDPSTRTLHGGAPVLEGEKWVATKWVRERAYL
jgi:prolyl 4-hydroxylase